MTLGYGISGIGYNPLGNLGLGMNGTYSSYDAYMPSTLGLNYGMGAMGMAHPLGMNYGMMGMYNPMYMAQMQQQFEASQAIHASNMHNILLNNEVQAHKETDSALVQKMLTNGDVQQGIQNLYNEVVKGQQDGICNEFDKLKTYIYNTYKNEFAARGDKINPAVSATQYIEALYSNMVGSSLRNDIIKNGDSSFKNGFMKSLRAGHHDRYVDETLNHCFGLEVDQQEGKEARQKLGKFAGGVTSVVEKGAIGAASATAVTGLTLGVVKLINSCLPKDGLNFIKNIKWGGPLKVAAGVGLLAGIVGDAIWQCSRD